LNDTTMTSRRLVPFSVRASASALVRYSGRASAFVRPLISTLIGVCGNAQDLAQRRHAEVGLREPLRRAALAGRHAAQVIGLAGARVAVGVVAAGEPVGGVEPAQLPERERRHGAMAVRRAIDRGVVHDDDLAVLGHADVELEHVGADLQRAPERVHRVRGELVLAALVGDVERLGLDPRVGGRARRRRRGCEGDGRQQRGPHQATACSIAPSDSISMRTTSPVVRNCGGSM
jgi:hypothetical protein